MYNFGVKKTISSDLFIRIIRFGEEEVGHGEKEIQLIRVAFGTFRLYIGQVRAAKGSSL